MLGSGIMSAEAHNERTRPLPKFRLRSRRPRIPAAVLLSFLALVLFESGRADAGWISTLARIGGEAGTAGAAGAKIGKVAGLGAALDEVARVVSKLPAVEKGGASLAAHATPEGHWKFVNREGEVFTAANADEIKRMTATLAPDLSPGGKLDLYLSEEAVFQQQALLKDLPDGANLHLVSGDNTYKLVRKGAGAEASLVAEIRPNVTIAVDDQDLFREALFHVNRPLNKSSIRLLSLAPDGPKGLGTVPRYDPVKKTALVDEIDPAALAGTLGKVKGQTVMLSGRLDGGKLTYKGAGGSDAALDIASLKSAAEAADVNLILLDSPVTRQPGGRNWLWQKVKVSGLDEALENKTFADFLDTLGKAQGELAVSASRDSYGRIAFQATPANTSVVPVPETVAGWWQEFAGETSGHLAVRSLHVFARDKDREEELDLRLIPGVPSWLQFLYIGSVFAGLIAWEVTGNWWSRIWPPEERPDYRSALGYQLARLVRWLSYVFLFLPFAGAPGILIVIAVQLWEIILAPFRFLRWLGRKIATLAGRAA